MVVKKIARRHQCMIPGCRSRNGNFVTAKSYGHGGVFICDDCIRGMAAEIAAADVTEIEEKVTEEELAVDEKKTSGSKKK